MPADYFTDPEHLADAIIKRVGHRLVLGLPLGLGKANHVANALVERATRDSGLSLTILTALTLEAPRAGSELERRFLEPLQERFFAGYPPLSYARALRDGTLPENIAVKEFYLQPGQWLGTERVQQNYTSINYTHVFDALLREGVNVVAQLIPPLRGEHYSLSSNPDISADLLAARAAGQADFMMVGQINSRLPYMLGAAERPAEDFDAVLHNDSLAFPLFSPPREPISPTDHAIGLQVARLVPDGGTLQIGIGSIGDAIANALIVRQRENTLFTDLLRGLGVAQDSPLCHSGRFQEGLYGLSEMLVEGFLDLIEAGVLKREAGGALIHAAFFLGSPGFYRALEALPRTQREKIHMMPVTFVNELYRDEAAKRGARRNARFVNSALLATLTGAIVSDGLENGQVISGVGGQYNFVAQAFALEGARSVIALRATRTHRGRAESNIRWSYGHTTIPRHLRDIVVSEYGVADLRGKSDAEVIAAMLAIADSRFQPELLHRAKEAGKLPQSYRIPEAHRHNTPARVAAGLRPGSAGGQLGPFPLGSDFSVAEQRLAPALKSLSAAAGSRREMARLIWRGWRRDGANAETPADTRACLARMGLEPARSWRDYLYRLLLLAVLEDAPPSGVEADAS